MIYKIIGKYEASFQNLFYLSISVILRALFGYEGQTNVLKVVSTGNGGLLELSDELNSGKILYAFVGITSEKTNLSKYLLINWQVGISFNGQQLIQKIFHM